MPLSSFSNPLQLEIASKSLSSKCQSKVSIEEADILLLIRDASSKIFGHMTLG